MENYMFCDHKKTKMKLVAWAFDVNDRRVVTNKKAKPVHTQGFSMKKCCARCGKLAA